MESGATRKKGRRRRRPHSPDRSEAAIRTIPASVLAGRTLTFFQNLRSFSCVTVVNVVTNCIEVVAIKNLTANSEITKKHD